MVEPSEAKYWAFISYSHADERWATWLHRSLETYKVPRPLVGTKGPDGVTLRPARLFPLFRDREELPSASSLSAQIEGALRTSRNLIVVCSSRAARSHWVNEEIKVFKAMGKGDRVFCLIVDGEPNAAGGPDGLQECFPEAIRFGVDAERRITAEPSEPIAADARPDKDGRRNALLKLLAGVLDVGFDNLRSRDQERRIRQYAITGAVLLAAVIAFAAIAYYALLKKEEAVREARAERASLSGQIATTSRLIFPNSPPRGLLLAVAALQVTEAKKEPRVPLAEEALREALSQAGGVVFPGTGEETAVEPSADGRWLALASAAGAQLWDLQKTDPRAAIRSLDQGRDPVAFSPDKRWLITGGSDRSVRLWRLDGGASAPVILPTQAHSDAVFAVSPDNHWLVTSSWSSEPYAGETDVARIFDLTAEHPEATGRALPGNTSSISNIVFSPDSRWLATSSGERDAHTFRQDKKIYLWDLMRKDPEAAPIVLQGHEESVTAMAISPDGHWLASGSEDRTVRLWDLTAADPAAQPLTLSGHENRVTGIAFGPDSRWLVTSTGHRLWNDSSAPDAPAARFWDLRNSPPASPTVFTAQGRAVPVSSFNVSPDGRRLLLTSGAAAYLVDLEAGEPAETFQRQPSGARISPGSLIGKSARPSRLDVQR